MFDLGPAAADLSRLIGGVRDDQLDGPTPCTQWRLADLLAHIHQFATVFTANAAKAPPAPVDGLPDDWRHVIPGRLDELSSAWRDPAAWEGRVSAGGVEMSGEENAVVAIEELVVHGWDVARASGQAFEPAEESLARVESFLDIFAAPLASGARPLRTGGRRGRRRLPARPLPGRGRPRPGLDPYGEMTVSSNVVAVKRTRTGTSSPTSGTWAPLDTNSIEACMCGGSANSRALPSTVYGDRTNPAASRPPRAIRAARSFNVAPPLGASRPMPCAVPPDTTRIVPSAGAVRLR